MIKTIIKEIGIGALLLIAIFLVLGIVFYDYIPNNKRVPIKIQAYSMPEDIKEDLDISKEALNILQRYEWKGNIRELKNTIENLVVLSRGNIIEEEDIPTYILESNIENNLDEDYPLDLNKAITQLEVNTIKKALDISNGNKSKAAKILNIPRTTLYYKLEQYQIDVSKK